jgi:hypothetical protein
VTTGADPVVGLAQVLSVFVGAATAVMIAPYLMVFVAGCAGGILGLMDWRKCTVLEGAAYVLGMGALAWMFAGTGAEYIAAHWVKIEDKHILAPVATGIGWVGHRWPKVGAWFGRMVRKTIEAAMSGGATK